MEFAEATVISGASSHMTEIEEYFVRELLRRNKQKADNASSSSFNGRKKLGNHITDEFDINGHSPKGFAAGQRYMSENLRDYTPWGLDRTQL